MNKNNIYIRRIIVRPFKEFNKDYLEKVVKESYSFREVGRKINFSHQSIKQTIIRCGIDFSHFKHGKAYDNMIGKKYHMLTIKNLYKKGKRVFAQCACECGEEKNIRIDDIKSGRAVSCGCHSKNRWNMVGEKNPYFQGVKELSKTKYSEIKKQAIKRGKKFTLSIDYLWDLFEKQNRKCALSGLEIKFGRNGYSNETSASLDRIDNNKDYIEGNVRWVLKDINMIRGSYNNDYFINLCKAVANNNIENIL